LEWIEALAEMTMGAADDSAEKVELHQRLDRFERSLDQLPPRVGRRCWRLTRRMSSRVAVSISV
jgi:hypothetical protein